MVATDTDSLSFLEFFQSDKETGRANSIVTMDLGEPRMIKNEHQYRITKKQAACFSQTLEHLQQQPAEAEDVHPFIASAREDALRSQLADLEEQLREYESLTLKAGSFEPDALNTVAKLPSILIKARIAQGLRQKDLAERLGLKEHQIQRYEANDYATASPRRIKEIANALGLESNRPTQIPPTPSQSKK